MAGRCREGLRRDKGHKVEVTGNLLKVGEVKFLEDERVKESQ
jgi:hypothetical protein